MRVCYGIWSVRWMYGKPLKTNMLSRTEEHFRGPLSAVGHRLVFVLGKLRQQGQESSILAVSHCDHGIATKTAPFSPPDWRSSQNTADLFRVYLCQPLQCRVHQLRPRLEFSCGCRRSFAVPWTDVLAYVAAEYLLSHP